MTVKQISYPVIVKKAVQEADGIAHITENVAFDLYSGSPVLTRSYDEYGGSYFSQNFMASWHHPLWGKRRKTRILSRSTPVRCCSIIRRTQTALRNCGKSPCPSPAIVSFRSPGDMLRIKLTSGVLLGHVLTADIAAGVLLLLPSALNTGNAAAANAKQSSAASA